MVDPTPKVVQQFLAAPNADRWADAPEVAPIAPATPRLARTVVPHEEVIASAAGDEAAGDEAAEDDSADRSPPEPLACAPSAIQPEQHRRLPSAGVMGHDAAAESVADRAAAEPATGRWFVPQTLLDRLAELSNEPAVRPWSLRAARLIGELGVAVDRNPDNAAGLIEQLGAMVAQVEPLASQLKDFRVACDFRRVGYALKRRVRVWEQIARLDGAEPIVQPPEAKPERLALALAKIDAVTGDSEIGKAWRAYLLIDALQEWSAEHPSRANIRTVDDRLPQTLAQQALRRLSQTPTSIPQRQFLSSKPLLALQAELRPWTVEPVHAAGLLSHIEQYEQTGLKSDARLLAKDCRYLAISSQADCIELAHRLDAHYRNANFRVAITEELLNRLMPERDPEVAPVRDTVLDMPVYGRSLTSTGVAVRMLPDPSRVRMALEITGQVESRTRSTSGPVTFFNGSDSTYVARKPLEVSLQGIRLWPAEVSVDNSTRLRRLETDFDGIPLVGSLVQGVARDQHEQKRFQAQQEIRQKIAAKAKQRIDSEADARLTKVTERFRQRIVEPLEALSLRPEMVDAETTAQRFTMRFRLAGEDQLGSHTPPPRAPSDSLASVQIHETAINNVLDRLELDGRTYTLPELTDHVAQRLNRPALWETDAENDDVSIAFAEHDAVTVRLQDDRIELTLAIAELSKGSRSWREFQARTYYKPQIEGRSILLARDGVVELNCPKLSTGARIALRGIFARIFLKNRPWTLTPESFIDHPNLDGVVFTQFIIDGGWLGAALGPARPTPRTVHDGATVRR